MIEQKQGCIEQEQDSIGQYEMVVGRVYDIRFKDCCVAGNFISRLIDVFNPGIENTDILKWTFANGVVLRRMECCIIREVDIAEDREFISRAKIEATLKRLASYYEGRARVAAKQMKEAVDCQSACDMGVVAARWEARRDGVLQVAENLDIQLEGANKVLLPHVKFTSSSYHSSYKAEIQKILQHLAGVHRASAETMRDPDSRLKCEGQEAAIYGVAEALGIELEGIAE